MAHFDERLISILLTLLAACGGARYKNLTTREGLLQSSLEEAVEQFSAGAVECRQVADQKLDTVGVGD